MNVFEFLFFSLLIVLIHGQAAQDRHRRWRQRVHEIRQMASVIRNIRGQAAVNRQRNIRPLPRHVQQANPQAQGSASPSENSQPRAFHLRQVVYAAINNASLGQEAAPADRSQDGPQAQEVDPTVASPIQNASFQGQQAPVNRNPNWRQRAHEIHQNASGDSEEEEESQPQSWRDLMTRNNVTNVHDFVRLLTREGQPVNEEELFERSENDEGKIVIAGSGNLLAVSDECSPRNSTVRLSLEEEDPNVVFYPECTRIERCGGCTPTPFLACTPVYKEIVVLTVLKARYPYPGALSMEMEGFAPVRVERHITCRATCTLKQEDCGQNSRFVWELCRCQCESYTPCTNGQVWDEMTCSCKCPEVVACCPVKNDRQCPVFFDHDYCECTLKQSVGADPNASQAEMEAWIASRRNNRPDLFLVTDANANASNTAATTPPTTTTTSTTTTTTAATTRPDCSHLSCPRHLVRGMSPSGRCLCQRRPRG